MSTAVLHETRFGIENRRQDYGLVRTYELTWRGAVNVARTEKVRVTVRVDSHPDQSRFLAEVWTANGWREVASIVGSDPLVTPPRGPERRGKTGVASPHVPSEYDREKVDSLEWAATELLARAKAVLS